MIATKQRKKVALNIADAAAALAVAKAKLGEAVKAFTPWPKVRHNPATDAWEVVPGEYSDAFTFEDLSRVHRNVRKLHQMLQRRAGSMSPVLPPALFESLDGFANTRSHTTPHLEGAVLALELVQRCGDVVGISMGLAVKMCAYELAQGLYFLMSETALDQILARHRRPVRAR